MAIKGSVQPDLINDDLNDSSVCWILLNLEIKPEELTSQQMMRIVGLVIEHVYRDQLIGKEIFRKWSENEQFTKEMEKRLKTNGPLENALQIFYRFIE